jgi:hypothetical protein
MIGTVSIIRSLWFCDDPKISTTEMEKEKKKGE